MDVLTLLVRDMSAYTAFVLIAFVGLCAIVSSVASAARLSRQAAAFRHQEKLAEQQRLWRDAKLIEQQPQPRSEHNRNNG